MHPAPARIDAPPRVSSQVSWNPAVPPPPVAGATVGNGVAEGVRVGDGRESVLGVADLLGFADVLGVADELLVTDELRVADELALGFAVAVAAVLGEIVGDAEALVPGVSFGSVAAGVDPEHATTNAEATMVMLAKPTAVSLAPSPGPAVVRRIFMGLLMPAADDEPFPGAQHDRHRRQTRPGPVPARGEPVAPGKHPRR